MSVRPSNSLYAKEGKMQGRRKRGKDGRREVDGRREGMSEEGRGGRERRNEGGNDGGRERGGREGGRE